MEKTKIIFTLLIISITSVVIAQETKKKDKHSPFSIYINTGLYSKIRGKIEYRFNEHNTLLVTAARYYGAANPGSQAYLEYRNYYSKKKELENFFYGKIGAGKSFSQGGKYGLFGAGIGQVIYLGKEQSFFVQLSEGVKICPTISGDVEASPGTGLAGLFYVIGPGSVVDLNFNLGYRF